METKRKHRAYVAFGSNLGNRLRYIERAIALIAGKPGIQLMRVSSLYETAPIGGLEQRDYLNGTLELRTNLKPRALLIELQLVEKELGRIREVKWGPRVIDLDLLTYDRKVIRNSNLIIPHPYYHLRRFVLIPFVELSPTFVHPVLQRQNRSILRRLTPLGQRVTMRARWKNTRFYQSKGRKKQKSQ